jgi:hypothetical protein
MASQHNSARAQERRLGHLALALGARKPISACAGASAAVGSGRCVVPLAPGASAPGNRIDGPDIPPPKYESVPRLPAGSPESVDYLNEHGYVVIASVLSDDEVERAVGHAWDFVEQCEPDGRLRRDDPASWSANWPSNWQARGSNHCAAMWYIRAAPGVRRAWAALLGADPDNLIVSFDQLNMSPLTEEAAVGPVASAWYHTDQSPAFRPGQAAQGSHGLHRDYAQGFVALQRTAKDLDNNVVVPGSHSLFEKWGLDYFDPSPSGGKRGIRYDLLTPDILPSACHGISTHLERGDAFVWDSRTLHGACKGPYSATISSHDARLARFAAYVCYSPRARATEEVISQRHDALANGIGFGHQVHHMHDETMMRQSQSGTVVGPQLTWEDLNQRQRRLVG